MSTWLARAALVLACAGLLWGCDGGGSDRSGSPSPADAGSPSGRLPQGSEPMTLDPADFSVDIDHEFWPMTPGTRWTYREVDEEGKAVKVVVTVTSATKKAANGVTARVVRDTVSTNGQVLEDTFDWYAQDADGNVWYLGENTAEFVNYMVSSREGSWEAGVDGALAGVILPAEPRPGMSYRQEYSKGQAEDNGAVLGVDEQVEVPAGHWTGALLTRDTNPLEPKVEELKLYAPGVGPALTVDVSGGAGREELLSMGTVSADAARAAGETPLGESYP